MQTDPPRQPTDRSARTAVLLLNLGTPAAPTPSAVRRYLAEFLSDRRVIDYPRWLWLPLLYGVILAVRPRRSAQAYRKVWTEQGSPLLVLSRALTARLAQRCANGGVRVELAMTYGEPAIGAGIERLLADGVQRLLLLPLYPQYSATSTAAALDRVFAALREQRRLPELRTLNSYHDAPEYISALCSSVQEHWREHGRGERLLLSFHGIPERYVRNGDPYLAQCLATAQALRAQLGLDENVLLVSFQSRVGRERWLGPYTDEVLEQLGRQGVRRVQALCPGFAVDCLETLEEIALRGREQFIAAGGETLEYIAALNDSEAHVQLLHGLIKAQTDGWTSA